MITSLARQGGRRYPQSRSAWAVAVHLPSGGAGVVPPTPYYDPIIIDGLSLFAEITIDGLSLDPDITLNASWIGSR